MSAYDAGGETHPFQSIRLSQSAMSRALDRLRSEPGGELLVRVGRNYELTPWGTALMNELGQIMPRLARLWEGERFSPAQSEAKIRLAMTDDAGSVVLPQLAEVLGRLAPGITLEVVPWHERTHEDHLGTHLMLSLRWQRLRHFVLSLCSKIALFVLPAGSSGGIRASIAICCTPGFERVRQIFEVRGL